MTIMKKYIEPALFSETCNVECVMNQISGGGSQGTVDAEVKKRGAEVLTDEEMDEEAIMQLIVDRESGNTSDLW
jgi:hypothetical protein